MANNEQSQITIEYAAEPTAQELGYMPAKLSGQWAINLFLEQFSKPTTEEEAK